MNLNSAPTLAQLQVLTLQADDEAGNHILWVDKQGEVHLSLVPAHLSPNGFEDSQPTMCMRYETAGRGNGYVGPEAAKNTELMSRMLVSLNREWADLGPSARVHYVDSF